MVITEKSPYFKFHSQDFKQNEDTTSIPSKPLYQSAAIWVKDKVHSIRCFLDKHTDIVSSLGILVITTCLLTSKIFKSTPKILPRVAKIVYDFGGIIWLNVQIRDLIKSGKDLFRTTQTHDLLGIVETAAKVLVKGVNVILTCVIFCGSVLSTLVMPQASLCIALSIRTFSLVCLAINVASDVRDYFANRELLKRLERMDAESNGSVLIGKVMICFLEIIKQLPSSRPKTEEYKLADRLVRQLNTFTLEIFQEALSKDRKEKRPLIDALKLFYGVTDGMHGSQAYTKANLSLTALGYVSMGICRAFPDSLTEMATRWSMSVLYTDKLLTEKFFQAELAENLN
jgi:hypothetical protein